MRTGQGIGKHAALAALMLAGLGVAAPAAAQTVVTAYYNPGIPGYIPPAGPTAVLSVPVRASVGGTCGFATGGAPNGSFTNLAVEGGWTAQVPFTAECTAPWRIAVSSANGALKNAASASTGYANKAPYDVALNVASDGGTVTGTCPVAQLDQALGSSGCSFKGTATTTNGLQIQRSFGLAGSYIRMTAPAYTGPILVNGTYSDTLIVTVSPAV